MSSRSVLQHLKKALLPAGAARRARRRPAHRHGGTSQAATPRPCDIYAAGGTPCVAAHSTTRALYGAYNGPLYQVRRASDNTTRDIGVAERGRRTPTPPRRTRSAPAPPASSPIIYDQSGRGQPPHPGAPRRLRRPGRGRLRQPRQRHRGADHRRRPQGVRRLRRPRHRLPQQHTPTASPPATSPRACTPSSTARTTTAAAASTTATPRPTAATTATAPWRPSTSATTRSGATAPATAPGSWPTWRTACSPASTPATTPTTRRINHRFLTAIVKGEPNHWAIRGGNAQSGGLSTFYNGARPNVAGLQPDAEGRRHHPRHRRRQQHRRRRHLLRGRDDLRLPVGRHRERRAGQHRRRRLQRRERGRRPAR